MGMESGRPRTRWTRRLRVWVVSLIGVVSLIWSVVSFFGSQSADDVERRVGDWWERAKRLVGLVIPGGPTGVDAKEAPGPVREASCPSVHELLDVIERQMGARRLTAPALQRYLDGENPRVLAQCVGWDAANRTPILREYGVGTPKSLEAGRLALSSFAVNACHTNNEPRPTDCRCVPIHHDGRAALSAVHFAELLAGLAECTP